MFGLFTIGGHTYWVRRRNRPPELHLASRAQGTEGQISEVDPDFTGIPVSDKAPNGKQNGNADALSRFPSPDNPQRPGMDFEEEL